MHLSYPGHPAVLALFFEPGCKRHHPGHAPFTRRTSLDQVAPSSLASGSSHGAGFVSFNIVWAHFQSGSRLMSIGGSPANASSTRVSFFFI